MLYIPAAEQYNCEASQAYVNQYERSNLFRKCLLPNILAAWNLSYNPALSVIDMGCGTGNFTRQLRNITGGHVLGVDISPSMVELADKSEADIKLGVRYRVADCAAPGFTSELGKEPLFDLVHAAWLFSYAESKSIIELVIQNMHDILKPHGTVVGVMNNPFVQPEKYSMYERYGLFITVEGDKTTVHDGLKYKNRIVTDPSQKPMEIVGSLWTPETIEGGFYKAGFHEFEFVEGEPIFLSKNEYEREFYQPYIQTPEFIIFKATK